MQQAEVVTADRLGKFNGTDGHELNNNPLIQFKNAIEKKMYLMQFNAKIRQQIYEKIIVLLKQKVSVYDAVKGLQEQYFVRKKTDVRAFVLAQWVLAMKEGADFSSACKDWLPKSEAAIISASKRSGDLVNALQLSVLAANSINQINSLIRINGAKPLMLLSAAYSMIMVFGLYVMPTQIQAIPIDKWPENSRNYYAFTQFFVNNTHFILLFIIGYFIYCLISMPRMRVGDIRNLIEFLPPWNIYKSMQSSIFLISLSNLLRTGFPIDNSLALLYENTGGYVKSHIEMIRAAMRRGVSHGEALLVGNFFDVESQANIAILSETADFKSALTTIGEEALKEAIKNIENKLKLLQSMAIISIAAFAGWTYMSMIGIMRSASTAI